jgi:tellurite resistance protein TerC
MDIVSRPPWMWAVFFAIFLGVLIFDLTILNRKDHIIRVRESLKLSAGYAALALLFGLFIWYREGGVNGGLFITGYLVELSLSMDNIFVISLVLSYFHVPQKYQHRVLFWGIIGVIVLRGIMIGVGAAVIAKFHWVLYFFAAFLIVTGVKMLFMKDDEEQDIAGNPAVRFFKKHMRVTHEFHEHHFITRKEDPKTGKTVLWFTPLMLALVVVECVDLIFAVDSIPAILAITQDTFLVYTSNLFAIMGLRSLYFSLAAMLDRFKYLKYSLALVLVFIGSKVFVVEFLDAEKFPPMLSLAITVGLLVGGALFSLYKTKDESKPAKAKH